MTNPTTPHPAAIRDNMKTNKFTVVGISRSELLKTVSVVASNEKEAIKRAKKKFIGGLRDCRVKEIV